MPTTTSPKPLWRDLPLYERVVVRQRLAPDDPGGYKFTDIKGIAYHIDDEGILMQPECNDIYVYLKADEIEAAKTIPPRPGRSPVPIPIDSDPD